MELLDAAGIAGLHRFFRPERAGPVIWAHVRRTGHGRARADRRDDPRAVHVEVGGNVALRGDPDAAEGLVTDLAGLVEAGPDWLPALRAADPGTAVWPRIVAVLPGSVALPTPAGPVRRLVAADADALAGLDPTLAWISATAGGPAGLAASGAAWAAFDGARVVSVACPFFRGDAHEDIGVVTEPDHRRRGLSTACAAAVAAEIRARGRRPSWTTSPENAGSRAVAARLGFVHERDDVLYAVRVPIPA